MVTRREELKDKKTRSPKKRLYGKYPNIDAEGFPGGRQVVFNNEDGAETYRIEGKGAYREENDFDGRASQVTRGPLHVSTAKGRTVTVSDSNDLQGSEHGRIGYVKGFVHETGKGHHLAAKGGQHKIVDGNKNEVHTAGTKTFIGATGSGGGEHVQTQDGDVHVQTRGDLVIYRKGNQINSTNGEVYEDVQDGNKSTVVEKKYKVYAKDEIIIESETKITLKVGSTYIKITPSDIIIHAEQDAYVDSNREINIYAEKHVLTATNQQGTKLEKGGAGTPPFTVNPAGKLNPPG